MVELEISSLTHSPPHRFVSKHKLKPQKQGDGGEDEAHIRLPTSSSSQMVA